MALVNCKECGQEVSTDAKKCPHCGAKLKSSVIVKVLGGCLILFLLFMGYGMTIPANESKANSYRRTCEREFIPKGLATQYDCDKMYNDIKSGRKN